ncbi:hypothetical protein Rhopal_003820-T1 [Rhodotorula paludigena]|uniref:MHYT domain-containing protein n=1 Tax=Rhodotorula paludigena TaxID=86838 RepID=A0AAV5GMN9_9BASI|nr:hypothetical protein Rhopal_003820-T1 [Rhodotorula paludigena]
MADQAPVYIELTAHYNGAFIFLSYLVSFVGSWTTLEMLLKRTGSTGKWNVMLLLGAGIAFGSTATFGMHFVGNQAVTLRFPAPWEGTGAPLSYNAGYTILSLVVAILSMILAFSFIGLRFNAPQWRSRLTDEEQGSTATSEKSAIAGHEDEEELATPEAVDKNPDMATGAAFDPDLKIEHGQQQTRFHLPGVRKVSLTPSAFNISLPKRRDSAFDDEKRPPPPDVDEDEDDESSDGGEFGIGAAKVSPWGVAKILLAGIVCGGGIAAMHYVGQVSINSVPRVTNDWYMVLISVLIAMACVSVGLYILFVIFRPKLQHSWYKRVIVAAILAVGVTLMHFVALLGTHYWARTGADLRTGSDNGTKTLIIVLICVVAPVCCILLLVFAFLGQQRALHQRAARHRIILSTAIFDQQGLLLVHPDSGLLPSAKIYPSKQNEPEKFNVFQVLSSGNRMRLEASKLKLQRSDPAFVAFLKMSWNWRTLKTPSAGAGGAIAEDLTSGPGSVSRLGEEERDVGTTTRMSEADDEMTSSEAELMRRSVLSFEMAGEEIASELTGTPNLKALGVLYDSILKIGHYQVSSKTSGDQFTVTQGQMLVLARRLKNNAEREALVARGYVFAEPAAVARVTSNAYAVPNERVFDHFRNVYRFTRFGVVKRLDRGRLYGGLLMLQALPGEGLHVVVDERQHHSLPMTDLAALVDPKADRTRFASSSLPTTTIDNVVASLQEIAGQSLLDLINAPSKGDAASELRGYIVKTLKPHLERVLSAETLDFLLSRLHVAPSIIPLSSRHGPTYGSEGLLKDSYLLCLKAVIPSSVSLPGHRLNWLPFPLYQAQADCVTRASGSASGGPRPNTGGSGVESGRFGAWSSNHSDRSGGRKGSVIEWSDSGDHAMFPTSSAAPFATSKGESSLHPLAQRVVGPSGQRGSTYSQSSTNEDDEDDTGSQPPRSTVGVSPELPEAVPPYSPDWIVGLIRSTVSAPGQHLWHWDVPHRPKGEKPQPRRST